MHTIVVRATQLPGGTAPAGSLLTVAYAMVDSPLGPFRRIGRILEQDPAVATGAGHHSVLHVPGSERLYIVYHRATPGYLHPGRS